MERGILPQPRPNRGRYQKGQNNKGNERIKDTAVIELGTIQEILEDGLVEHTAVRKEVTSLYNCWGDTVYATAEPPTKG